MRRGVPARLGQNDVADNVIVNNAYGGVMLEKGVHDNVIARNLIGVLPGGAAAPNVIWGVRIEKGSFHNTVGPDNDIAFNPNGVQLTPDGCSPPSPTPVETDTNTVTRNTIRGVSGLGIDIAALGSVTTSNGMVNDGVAIPGVAARATSVTVTACAGCTVEVFRSAPRRAVRTGRGVRRVRGRRRLRVATLLIAADLQGSAVTATATDAASGTSEFARNVTVPAVPSGGGYVPLVPARLLETRPGATTIDGQAHGTGTRPAGTTTELQITGRAGVPTDATAVVLNIAVTEAHQHPASSPSSPAAPTDPTPPTSTTPPARPSPTPSSPRSAPTARSASTPTPPPTSSPTSTATSPPAPPTTRSSRPASSRPDHGGHHHRRPGHGTGTTRRRDHHRAADHRTRTASPPTPPPSSSTSPSPTPHAPGFITVFPCGTDRPNASNLNYTTGQTIPNAVIAKIGTNGKVCIYTHATTDLIADVNGYFPAGTTYAPARPRPGCSTPRARRHHHRRSGRRHRHHAPPAPPPSCRSPDATASPPTPPPSSSTSPSPTPQAPGFITVFPCGTDRPNASNLNYTAGQTIPNAVIAKIGTNGKVCIYTLAATDLIADVNGYFPG